jgi:hypothetical protein
MPVFGPAAPRAITTRFQATRTSFRHTSTCLDPPPRVSTPSHTSRHTRTPLDPPPTRFDSQPRVLTPQHPFSTPSTPFEPLSEPQHPLFEPPAPRFVPPAPIPSHQHPLSITNTHSKPLAPPFPPPALPKHTYEQSYVCFPFYFYSLPPEMLVRAVVHMFLNFLFLFLI